jgi:hypothetical protein
LALAFGLTLAVALLRQVFLLFIPFLFLWLLWASRGKQLPELLASGAVLVALILPITFFNYTRFHRFVLLNTNAGFAFYWGNHPFYGTHFEPILPSETYASLLPPELLNLDEAALDQALLKRGIGFVLADPLRYVLLSASRIPAYFMFWLLANRVGLATSLAWQVLNLVAFMLYGHCSCPFRQSARSPNRLSEPVFLLYLFMVFLFSFTYSPGL